MRRGMSEEDADAAAARRRGSTRQPRRAPGEPHRGGGLEPGAQVLWLAALECGASITNREGSQLLRLIAQRELAAAAAAWYSGVQRKTR